MEMSESKKIIEREKQRQKEAEEKLGRACSHLWQKTVCREQDWKLEARDFGMYLSVSCSRN